MEKEEGEEEGDGKGEGILVTSSAVLYNFLGTLKAAPRKCVIRDIGKS